jgi:two-component system, LytTR family, response regulator
MTLKAVLIDDEFAARENLGFMIKNLYPGAILHEAESVLEGKKLIDEHHPEIIFLDINMPVYSGFDLFELIDSKDFIVVIVTAHINHSLKAFKKRAFDFLLKPFGIGTLKNTMERIIEELENKKTTTNTKSLEQFHYTFKTKNETHYIIPQDILYFESDNNYTTIYLLNGTKILISKTIKSIEEELQHSFFYRIHRSFIINSNYITKYNSLDGYVYLNNSTQIPISDRKRKEFVRFLSHKE